MSGLFHATYQCLYFLYDCFRLSWPISLVYHARLKDPTPKTWGYVKLLGPLMYDKDDTENKTPKLLQKIEELPFDEDILAVKDPDQNLDLLHHAIITNTKEAVNLLLQKVHMKPMLTCNSYVHLAASLGHVYILQSLMERRPHDIHSAAGLCYPEVHEPVLQKFIYGVVYNTKYRCQMEKYLPIEYALMHDNIKCVKILYSAMSDSCYHRNPSPSHLLHFASERGAAKCMEYFISKFPDEINSTDAEGDLPLLKAVVWGKTCSKLLIDNGADVKCVAQNGDTALHRLYRNDIDGIFAIFDTTKYLLTTGIEQLVNCINSKGETALHLLVTHISFIGGDFLHEDERVSRSELQLDYQEQVIQTIRLLLKFNADPLILDSNDFQPLNKLLHIAVKASCPQDPCECVQASINSEFVYLNDFKHLARAMEILLDNGADVNTQCAMGHSPLILFIQCLYKTEFSDMVQQADSIIACVEVLLHSGANCDFLSEDHATCSTLLAKIAGRMLKSRITAEASLDGKTSLKQQMASLLNIILQTFLKHGMDTNYTTSKKSPHLMGGDGNALIEFVRLTMYAYFAEDFGIVRSWLVTLLQWGANPDLEPYPSDPIICHSQSSIFLKKQGTQAISHCMSELKDQGDIFENGAAEGLLMLFYNTMDHTTLFSCINTACSVARFHPPSSGNKYLALLHSLSDQPRSLKRIARISIYKAVNHNIAQTVDQLPLPRSMKDYLLNID